MKPTKEQQAIIEAYKTGENILVQACAGSGKSTTICMAAKSIKRTGLYLAFNKMIAQDIKGKLPDYVESSTIHSLAYRNLGYKYKHKLQRPRGKYINMAGTASEIARYYDISPHQGISEVELAVLVKDTVGKFESSDDITVENKHISQSGLEDLINKVKRRSVSKTGRFKELNVNVIKVLVLQYARQLWEDRIDLTSEVLATHDTYLKLYQLEGVPPLGAETIFIDECQDITPCVYDIIKQQESHSQIVAVGDEFQSLYAWRGAINAMKLFPYKKYTLSQSFRFGNAIADLANKALKDTNSSEIQGNPKQTSYVQHFDYYPYTYIARTNISIVTKALYCIDNDIPVHLHINVEDFCKLIKHAEYLSLGHVDKVKHQDLIGYQSWEELLIESENDYYLERLVKIVSSGEVDSIIRKLKSNVNPENPKVICVTAYKSKGLEWDNVKLSDDLRVPNNDNVTISPMDRNLLYVALTRARVSIQLSNSISKYLKQLPDESELPF